MMSGAVDAKAHNILLKSELSHQSLSGETTIPTNVHGYGLCSTVASGITTPIGALIAEGALLAERDSPALVVWSASEGRVARKVTFTELAFIAERVAKALTFHGVRPGDPVALLSHPTLDYFTTVAGIFMLGAVAVNINWRAPEDTMRYMTMLARSRRIISSAHFIEKGIAGRLLLGQHQHDILGFNFCLTLFLETKIA
jgi:non-ribosomal peptide synthetase component F